MAKKILMIDDEPNLVKVVTARLAANGYEVIGASDGFEGLRMLREERPDLIILDVLMPKMDGYTFVRTAKADGAINQIPIILLTAREKVEDLFKIEGIHDYVVKPFNAEELLERVNKYLR